jgi:nucleoside-diphosphate-sugar epimerase
MMDTTKAKQLLDFEPRIAFEDGLRDTVAWYKQSIAPINDY